MTVLRRLSMTGSQPDEAADGFARAFPGLRVGASAGHDPFDLAYRSVATERFSLHRLTCSGRLHASGPLPEAVSVGRRLAGHVSITRDGRPVDTSRPYLRPVAASQFELREGGVALCTVQPAALAEYAERSGQRPIRLGHLPTRPQLTALGLVLEHAGAFVDDPDALTREAEEELLDLLCFALLQAFSDPWAETGRHGVRSRALHRAVAWIDEHADEVVTMADVAAAARISVRSLGLLFRRELDTTPLRYLHDLRLDRARLDLLAGSGSVAEVAARHGLRHAGRFSAQYRARFAELPATTLRGATGDAGSPAPDGGATGTGEAD